MARICLLPGDEWKNFKCLVLDGRKAISPEMETRFKIVFLGALGAAAEFFGYLLLDPDGLSEELRQSAYDQWIENLQSEMAALDPTALPPTFELYRLSRKEGESKPST
jgi:hypothetical protein